MVNITESIQPNTNREDPIMKKLLCSASLAALMSTAAWGIALAQTNDTSASASSNSASSGDANQASSSNSGGNSQSGGANMQREASDVTCRELTGMDTATVPGILYFISGYNAGSQKGMNGQAMNGGQMNAGQGAGSADNNMAASGNSSGSSAATTNADNSSSTAGSATNNAANSSDASASTAGTTTSTDLTNSGKSGSSGASASADNSDTSNTSASKSSTATDTTSDNSAANGNAGAKTGTAGGTMRVSALRGYFDIPVEKTVVACRNAPDSRASDVIKQQGGSASGNASDGSSGSSPQ